MKLKVFLHCMKCKKRRECKIKFCPTGEVIYTSSKFTNGLIILEDPIKCPTPLK